MRSVILGVLLMAGPCWAGDGVLRIYLARHGQTDWNLQGKDQGWKDIPLNATGEEQAKALHAAFQGSDLEAIYSSTLVRSRRTAEIASGGKFAVTALPELRERRSAQADEPEVPAETSEEFLARVESGVATIRRKHGSGAILIVGHGGTNRLILRILLGLSAEEASVISQDNDEVYLIEMQGDRAARVMKRVGRDRLGDL